MTTSPDEASRFRIPVPFDEALNGLLRVRKLKPVKRTRMAKQPKVRAASADKPRSR